MPLIPKQPRIAPTAPPFDDDTRAALDILGPPIALFGVFARRPERAHAIAGWERYYLTRRGALSLRHRELAIDRTTVNALRLPAEPGTPALLTPTRASTTATGGDDRCTD